MIFLVCAILLFCFICAQFLFTFICMQSLIPPSIFRRKSSLSVSRQVFCTLKQVLLLPDA